MRYAPMHHGEILRYSNDRGRTDTVCVDGRRRHCDNRRAGVGDDRFALCLAYVGNEPANTASRHQFQASHSAK